MTALKGFEFDGETKGKKKGRKAKYSPPPAKTKVPVRPTKVFETVPVPRPIREPEEFEPSSKPDTNSAMRTNVRVRTYDDIDVAYKFLRRQDSAAMSGVLKGKLLDISEGGLQIDGPLSPDISIATLKSGDVLIGMNVFLPYIDGRMKVLGQITRQESGEQEGTAKLGVRFIDIDEATKAQLKAYFIASQMPSRKKRAPKPD